MKSTDEAKLPITVVILTLNEQMTVRRAISSAINDFSEVVVLDSFSSDDTTQIARECGARVVEHQFVGYASQRNFALKEMKKLNSWVLFLDADEMISEDLIIELREDFNPLEKQVGIYFIRRKDFMYGRWIRRSSAYPTWFGRLCSSDLVSVTREVNEEFNFAGDARYLSSHLIHYPFVKGFENWFDRHNKYSTGEASLIVNESPQGLNVRHFVDANPSVRRQAFKRIYLKLPARPLISFLYLYVYRMGFLDGRAGFDYALLRTLYEVLISMKVREMRNEKRVQRVK